MPETATSDPIIHTCGYGGIGFERFVEAMKQRQITHVADIRSTPGSTYWKDFCRPRLDDLMTEADLKYVFLGDTLGAKVLHRDEPGTEAAAEGERLLGLGIVKLIAAAASGKSICLMCGCSRPEECHRSHVLGEELRQRGVDLRHIMPDGSIILQSDLAKGARQGQASLF